MTKDGQEMSATGQRKRKDGQTTMTQWVDELGHDGSTSSTSSQAASTRPFKVPNLNGNCACAAETEKNNHMIKKDMLPRLQTLEAKCSVMASQIVELNKGKTPKDAEKVLSDAIDSIESGEDISVDDSLKIIKTCHFKSDDEQTVTGNESAVADRNSNLEDNEDTNDDVQPEDNVQDDPSERGVLTQIDINSMSSID